MSMTKVLKPPSVRLKTRDAERKSRSKEIMQTVRKAFFIISTVVMGIVIARYVLPEVKIKLRDNVISSASQSAELLFIEQNCSSSFLKEIEKSYPQCKPRNCGRAVTDTLISQTEALSLLQVAKKGLALAGGSGGASILDLHSGAISFGEKFVDINSLITKDMDPLLSKADRDVYHSIVSKVQGKIAEVFGVDSKALHLTSPTFFSRMTDKPAKTLHDEYWHSHVDKETYGSFHFTSLLYLSTFNDDFTGGRFIFLDNSTTSDAKPKPVPIQSFVEPKFGRVSMFSSGSENTHRVEKVASGTRYALTIAYTCDSTKAINSLKV